MTLIRDGWVEAPETNRRKGVDFARHALEVAGNDPGILANAALALGYFDEDIGAMLGLVDRALALNPSFARGWYVRGMLRIFAGEHDLAIEHLETSLRLSPREREVLEQMALGKNNAAIAGALFLTERAVEKHTNAIFGKLGVNTRAAAGSLAHRLGIRCRDPWSG